MEFENDKGNEKWTITAAEGRVDVLLRRRNPLGTVIIENKSNGEEDQTEPIVPMLVWEHSQVQSELQKNLLLKAPRVDKSI